MLIIRCSAFDPGIPEKQTGAHHQTITGPLLG